MLQICHALRPFVSDMPGHQESVGSGTELRAPEKLAAAADASAAPGPPGSAAVVSRLAARFSISGRCLSSLPRACLPGWPADGAGRGKNAALAARAVRRRLETWRGAAENGLRRARRAGGDRPVKWPVKRRPFICRCLAAAGPETAPDESRRYVTRSRRIMILIRRSVARPADSARRSRRGDERHLAGYAYHWRDETMAPEGGGGKGR